MSHFEALVGGYCGSSRFMFIPADPKAQYIGYPPQCAYGDSSTTCKKTKLYITYAQSGITAIPLGLSMFVLNNILWICFCPVVDNVVTIILL